MTPILVTFGNDTTVVLIASSVTPLEVRVRDALLVPGETVTVRFLMEDCPHEIVALACVAGRDRIRFVHFVLGMPEGVDDRVLH